MPQIEGKAVLVTGGQRGLGAAFASELLRRGAAKVYVTARVPSPVDDPRVVPLALDVTDQHSVARLAEAADDASIVINNAGAVVPTVILDTPVEMMRDLFDTNVFGPIRVTKAFAPILAKHAGSTLVNIHSVFSWLAGSGAYGASKAALWSMTNSLRLELASQRTTVIGVHLSYADTDMTARLSVAKTAPERVASVVASGIERGDTEILVDDASHQAKAVLAGPVEGLVLPATS